MARLSSSTGLVTGIDIEGTVEKLMAVASVTRNNLETRIEAMEEEQTAVTDVATLLAVVQYVGTNLTKDDLYDARTVSTSSSSLTATVTENTAAVGTYVFTPIQTVQAQQLLGDGVKSSSSALTSGTVTMRFGDNVERSLDLDALNSGQGFVAGKIRITDRSGSSAVVDLSTAQSLDDVLDTINSQTDINVTAEANGDKLQLVDNTGQTTSNLIVQEVAGGTTAASLGLNGIDVASATASGTDIVQLSRDTELDLLNDGSGVRISSVLADIKYTLADGTTGTIDFSPILSGSTTVDTDETLGDILDRVNAAAEGKLEMRISDDGDRLEVVDLTEGEGTFALESVESQALVDLGLDGEAVDGVITGRRLLGGLKSVLLSSLNGGKGYGELGAIALTDRSGASATVDLASAETLDDVVNLINASGVGITARVNSSATGLELVDATGSSSHNLVVASADDLKTAEALGLAIDEATSSVNTGDMHLQVVAHNTRLDALNGGAGVAAGTFTITDATGLSGKVDLSSDGMDTIGDVIAAINRLGLSVRAEINSTGDGIQLIDTAAKGTKTLTVTEGSSTAAADLHLLGTATAVDLDGDGTSTNVIDGSFTEVFELDGTTSLDDLVEQINKAGIGITAAIFNDGSSSPYRLSLTSDQAGSSGTMVVDISGLDMELTEVTQARDALLAYGNMSSSSSVLVRSATNSFTSVLPGVTLSVAEGTGEATTVTVSQSNTNLVATLESFVENYNSLIEYIDEATFFNTETNEGSVLTGDATVLRVESDLTRLLTSRNTALKKYQSLADVGITFGDDGLMEFDSTVLEEAFADDPDAVRDFFTDETNGFAILFDNLCDTLVGSDGSLLAARYDTITNKIDDNTERLDEMDEQLAAEEERLYTYYYNLEIAVNKIQTNADYLDQIAYMNADGSYSSDE